MAATINYLDFRKNFLDEVTRTGLQLHSIQYRGLSPEGRPLFTDVAHTQYNANLPTIVHISGTHGIEGYLGSSIQTQLLRDMDPSVFAKVNVIFIHALNPWGMAWYRRVNAHNVDLNRNFFPEGEERPKNHDFEVFAPLADKKNTLPKWKIWWRIFKFILKNGLQKTLQTVTEGQFHMPDAIFFGGTAIENEIHEPIRYIRGLIRGEKPIYVLDVHSGLGKFASENLLMDGKQNEKETQFWMQHFPSAIDPGHTPGFYAVKGGLSYAFRHYFTKNTVHYLCEEFGTWSKWDIFTSLLKEHQLFMKLKVDKTRAYSMIRGYYPYEGSWRQKTVELGKKSFHQLVGALS